MQSSNGNAMSTEFGKTPYYNSNPGYSNNPIYPRPVEAERVSGCFERNQKNKPQSNSAGAAALVFICGGMNIAWTFGFNENVFATKYTRISWFIMAIVGAFCGAILCNLIKKKILYLFAAICVIISGIVLLALPRDLDAILAARHLDGFATGLVLVPTLVMAGEEAVKALRGMISGSLETMCFTLGIYIQIIFAASWPDVNSNTFSLEQLRGTLNVVYGLISLVIAFFLVIESPVYFLVRGEEREAIDSLRRLQRPFIVTTETYEQLQEHKAYINMNREMSLGESLVAGLPALFKLTFYRSLNALTFCSWLSAAFATSYYIAIGIYSVWPVIVFGTARWIGSLISVFVLDSVGRKKPMLFGAIVCGGMAIGVGIVYNDIYNLYDSSRMSIVMYLLLVFQLFAGVFIPPSSPYLSEAFPLAVKPYYIAFAFSIEMVIQIIMSVITLYSIQSLANFFFAFGSLLIVFFIFGLLMLPETKYTTLREAQTKFHKLIPQQN